MNAKYIPGEIRWVAIVSLLATLVTGCGGKYLPPYVQSQDGQAAVTKESAGLRLSVKPVLDRQICQTYFGMDCLAKGILPVHLHAANEGSSSTYRIESKDIWFETAANGALRVKEGLVDTNNTAAGSATAVAGGVVAAISPLTGIFIAGAGMKATDDAESVKENFVIKHFQNVTLTPGKTSDGFLYFVQPQPIAINSLPTVNISIRDVATKDTTILNFSLGQSH